MIKRERVLAQMDNFHKSQQRERIQKECKTHKVVMEEKYDLVGHPKADKLYEIAWDMGHSSEMCCGGLYEVEIFYGDMADLLKSSEQDRITKLIEACQLMLVEQLRFQAAHGFEDSPGVILARAAIAKLEKI